MVDALICEPIRTPVGGLGGSLRDVPPRLAMSADESRQTSHSMQPDLAVLWRRPHQ
jgi:acetyl-CoA C-acetyltransferase